MKIATMVRAFLPAPLPSDVAYSPMGAAILIAEGLAKKGHSVTFYAPESSRLKTNIETLGIQPLVKNEHDLDNLVDTTDLFRDYIPSLYDQCMARDMFQKASSGEFDILLYHHPESSIGYSRLFPEVPVVYILHDFLDKERQDMFQIHQANNQHFISISNSQRKLAPNLPYAATIYHGIDEKLFSFCDQPEDYLLFVGRIAPEKGTHEAIQVAIQTNKRLYIAGQVLSNQRKYFNKYIKPYLNDKIIYLGMIDKNKLVGYYQKAQALLVPIGWEEPFGLIMIEAMACGTPVIAFNRGSVSEIIQDKKTGYIVNNTSEMIEAVKSIDNIKRYDCRRRIENYFTQKQMVANYEKALLDIIPKASS